MQSAPVTQGWIEEMAAKGVDAPALIERAQALMEESIQNKKDLWSMAGIEPQVRKDGTKNTAVRCPNLRLVVWGSPGEPVLAQVP